MNIALHFALSILVLAISLAYIVLNIQKLSQKCDRCEMSFMAGHLEDLTDEFVKNMETFPHYYRIYFYNEFKSDEMTASKRFTCTPVLFIPGNSGSSRQVRSIASWARWPRDESGDLVANEKQCMVFYTLDFLEEMSALLGSSLQDQISYTLRVLEWLSRMHKDSKALFLIGHSMGGLVARIVSQSFQQKPLIVLTLSTPHLRPPLTIDRQLIATYEQMNRQEQGQHLIISIGGGHSDVQIRPELSRLARSGKFVYSLSEAVPYAWTSPNHQAIVWTHALVRQISQFLWAVALDPPELSKKHALDSFALPASLQIH